MRVDEFDRLSDGVIALRRWREDDSEFIYRCCQDEAIQRFTFVPTPYTRDNALEYVTARSDDVLDLAVADAGSDEALGAVGIGIDHANKVAQAGYWIAPERRGRGIAPRALTLLARWAFDNLDIARLQLYTHTYNPASQRVAEKAGFVREGTLRSYRDIKGRREDVVMFSLLPQDVQRASGIE